MDFEILIEVSDFIKLDRKLVEYFLEYVEKKENKRIGEINFSFVSDKKILEINNQFLKHDYYTDIITFDTSFINIINGDIIISFDTIKTNVLKFDTNLDSEVYRVIIHGVMHLCGYKDYTENEKIVMRNKENQYLDYFEKIKINLQ